jgi:hypothetical protein
MVPKNASRIEMVSLYGLDFPPGYGYGYGEFKMVDDAGQNSESLSDTVRQLVRSSLREGLRSAFSRSFGFDQLRERGRSSDSDCDLRCPLSRGYAEGANLW